MRGVLADPTLRRFVVAGGVSTALGFVLFHGFLRLYAGRAGAAGLAQASAYPIGIAVSYLLSRQWTFRSTGAHGRQLPRYVAVHVAALATSSLLVERGVSTLRLPVTPVWIAVIGFTTGASFLLQRYWVFAHRTSPRHG